MSGAATARGPDVVAQDELTPRNGGAGEPSDTKRSAASRHDQ